MTGDALASAGKTLVELFGLARELNVEAEGIEVGPSPMDQALQQDLALMIDELDPAGAFLQMLSSARAVHTVGELSRAARRTCSTSATSVPSRSPRSRRSWPSWACPSRDPPVDYVSEDDYTSPTFSDEQQA